MIKFALQHHILPNTPEDTPVMTPPPSKESITAVILCGGAGKRMGGRDKGQLTLAGRSLLQHVIDRVAPQCGGLMVNSNSQAETTRTTPAVPIIHDRLSGQLGPLAGIHAALAATTTPWVLSVPCDAPLLPSDLVERMIAALVEHPASLCTVREGENLHGVIQLLHRDLSGALEQFLLNRGRRVRDWLDQTAHVEARYTGPDERFANINTPEQLQRLEASYDH